MLFGVIVLLLAGICWLAAALHALKMNVDLFLSCYYLHYRKWNEKQMPVYQEQLNNHTKRLVEQYLVPKRTWWNK